MLTTRQLLNRYANFPVATRVNYDGKTWAIHSINAQRHGPWSVVLVPPGRLTGEQVRRQGLVFDIRPEFLDRPMWDVF